MQTTISTNWISCLLLGSIEQLIRAVATPPPQPDDLPIRRGCHRAEDNAGPLAAPQHE